jgi:hypothetical protein
MPVALPPGRAQRLKNTLEVQRRPADGFEHFGRSGLDRVEAWDVAAPGEVADSLFRPQPLNWTFARTCSNRLAANSESSRVVFPYMCSWHLM